MSMLRTFVAVEMSAEVCRRAGKLIEKLSRSNAKVKWVSADALHLTLCFLGDVDARVTPQLCQMVATSAKKFPPLEIQCAGVGAFPNANRPTTIWVGVQQGAGELCSLQTAIADALAAEGYPKETRRYHPHLTLGRVRRGAPTSELPEFLRQHESYDVGKSVVNEVVVFSSDLQPAGPVYHALSRIPLAS